MRARPPARSTGRAAPPAEVPAAAAAEDLLAALRERRPGAAQTLWDEHSALVRRLLGRALGPREDVDDLTQEVFLRVFSRVHTIRNASVLREFVTSVAIRVLKWELRRRWVRRKVRLSVTGSVPEVEAAGADQEARHALARCYVILDRLSARERAAFVLRYMEEMRMDEVAAALGVSLSTAKRLVNRGAEKVGKLLTHDQDLRRYFDHGERDDAAHEGGTRG